MGFLRRNTLRKEFDEKLIEHFQIEKVFRFSDFQLKQHLSGGLETFLDQTLLSVLIEQLFKQKEEWNRQKSLVEKSLEPSAEVLFELKLV
jgi:hypothetical protein